MPLELMFSNSDLIATAALLIAGVGALYARGARNAAARANEISLHESRRPLRLLVFQAMHQFSHYCATYWTLYCMGEVKRSRELTARIDTFKWEIEQHGHLDMPEVDAKVQQLISSAWKMQRLIDRIAGKQTESMDRAYASAEENVQGLVERFAKENSELKALFQPYLTAA